MSRIMKLFAVLAVVATLAGCQTMTGKTASENVSDATITASVKAKLIGESAANLTRVDVDTNQGTVYLNGIVPNEAARARAKTLAMSVGGVKDVVSNLQVEPR